MNQLSLEELKKLSVFIAIPSIDGKIEIMTMKSIIETQNVLSQLGVKSTIYFECYDSFVTRARNMCVMEFLENPKNKDYTHFMFIDSDIEFPREAIVNLLSLDKDIIGANYPKKSLNFDMISKAYNDGVKPEFLHKYGTKPVVSLRQDKGMVQVKSNELFECDYLGTGFMLIKREVFTDLIQKLPLKKVKSGRKGDVCDMYLFFDASVNHRDLYLSEDYDFCEKTIKCGYVPLVAPWIQLNHMGKYKFEGDMLRGWGGRYPNELKS